MAVVINDFNLKMITNFIDERDRLRELLGNEVSIEPIGSAALGIGGKNVIDLLIGTKDADEMFKVRDILSEHGYFFGKDIHGDRIFMVSSDGETREGDFHVQICPKDSDTYNDFIVLRDYFRNNRDKVSEYFAAKNQFAEESNFDAKKYRALKSAYLSGALEEARKWSHERPKKKSFST